MRRWPESRRRTTSARRRPRRGDDLGEETTPALEVVRWHGAHDACAELVIWLRACAGSRLPAARHKVVERRARGARGGQAASLHLGPPRSFLRGRIISRRASPTICRMPEVRSVHGRTWHEVLERRCRARARARARACGGAIAAAAPPCRRAARAVCQRRCGRLFGRRCDRLHVRHGRHHRLLGPLVPLLLGLADRQWLIEEQAVCLRRLHS